jgi:hypothetical protein
MNDSFCAVLRSAPRFVTRSLPLAACLLALSAALAGCTSEQDEPVFSDTHAARNAADPLFNVTPADIRHHERLAHTAQSRRHPLPGSPEGPAPIN